MNNCKYCGREINTSSFSCESCQRKLNKIGFLLQSLNADNKTIEDAYKQTENELSNKRNKKNE